MQVTVEKVGYDNTIGAYYYKIKEDSGEYWWCNSCLEPIEVVADLPEFDATSSIDSLLL